ncbi:MAG: hypothetical protein MJY71_06155 [Bacteroidaceae bacterium]|nr:hypothetical protein [Bacteroidaceae bacterium]
MTLHIFNPEHDTALVSKSPFNRYPRPLLDFANDLAAMPLWWAKKGDAIAVPNERAACEWAQTLPFEMPHVEFVEWSQLKTLYFNKIDPWGWDRGLRKKLQYYGIGIEFELENIKHLSSRQFAVFALQQVKQQAAVSAPTLECIGDSTFCTSMEQVRAAIASTPYAVLKAPWSGSGKGLRWTSGGIDAEIEQWCMRIMNTQKGISVEPRLSKTADFALEYTCSDGVVCYTGLSVFQNTDQGIYAGNLICKDETVKLKRIGLSSSALEQLVKLHIALLEQHVAPYYNGPLGIDCMVCGSAIQPFVEMNLRRTAGMLALSIEERMRTAASAASAAASAMDIEKMYLSHLEYFEDTIALDVRYNTLRAEYGYDVILLAPLTDTSHYLHYLLP